MDSSVCSFRGFRLSILQEILEWSQAIPDWQSDAIGRLLSKPELTEDDLADLLALLKIEHGIPDPQGRSATKLSAAQVPAAPNPDAPVQLVAIKNLLHVNAIAEQQRLEFSPSGLSVIYGANGSGKSGYSRVLKRACRARDQSEPIHPNAKQPANPGVRPEATFEIAVSGAIQELRWTDGAETPTQLSTISIFDSRCAHAYLEDEDDFSYVPYGLDILERLAKTCHQLKGRVDAEIKQFAVDLKAFDSLTGDTEVGRLIAKLSAKANPAEIEALATLSDAEVTEQANLSKILKESDPKEKAVQLRLRARRVATVAATIKKKGEWVSVAAISNLRELADKYRETKRVAKLAAIEFKESEELLPGTGGEAWRALFEAARAFVKESHPDQVISQLEAEAPCPLCQQTLGEGATRLSRFDAFIEAEAERAADAARSALNAVYQPFIKHDLSINLDDVTYGEVEGADEGLAKDARVFEAAIEERHKAVQEALKSDEWGGLDQPIVNPSGRLEKLADNLNQEAEVLEKASDEENRAVILKALEELNARVALGKVKAAVLESVSKLVHIDRLTKCLSSLRTNAISLKANDLAAKVVSKELETALNDEFKALGVGQLQVTLTSRAEKGRPVHRLRLNLPQNRSPREILSEGEQRAVAIGSFLAEVRLSGGSGGVVFDDPMSSLDHRRREKIAQRLVAEASCRQVIVFTHDIYFLCLLTEESAKAGVTISTQSLVRRPEGFGITDAELPFEGKNTKQRIGALKAQQQAIAKLYRDGDEKQHREQTVDAYFHLRMAWERAVEDVLLRQVVIRFRKGVETQRLVEVAVEDDDYSRVFSGMAKCSNYAHDKAMEGGIAVPEPDELLADIEDLESWRAALEARSQDTRKRRKK